MGLRRTTARPLLLMLLVVSAAAAGGCAAPVPEVEVSSDAVAQLGQIMALLPASLDGREVDLIVDTGAELTLMDAELASELGLDVRSRWFPRRFQFIDGTQYSRRYVRVERLEIAGTAVGPLELPLTDLEAAGGPARSVILGCDVLRQCRILFDAGSRDVRFLASPEEAQLALRDLRPTRTFAPLELSWKGMRPFVEVARGAGPTASFLVDTGALQTFVSEETLRALDLGRRLDKDADGGTALVEDLSIGPWRAWLVVSVDASSRADALGFDVLRHLTFLWDGPGDKLWIAAPLPGEPDTLTAGVMIHEVLRELGVDPEAR